MQSKIHNQKYKIQLPPALQPGDLLRVVAPSGCLRELEAFEKGVEIWRSRGYRVELSPGFDDRWGYLAGKDGDRRRQLADAWKDPECRGVLCARGGYGGARLLEDWSWGAGELGRGGAEEQGSSVAGTPRGGVGAASSVAGEQGRIPNSQFPIPNSQFPIPNSQFPIPKWLIGFSDITGLLWSLCKAGVAGVHGPLLTTIAAEPEWSIQRLFDLVEGRAIAPIEGKGWGGGKASGHLLPANLTVATHVLNTAVQPSLDGAILAFEDVGEAPYRIDRMLTQWRMMGALRGVRAIAIGRFSQCDPPGNIPSFTVDEVLRDRLSDLGIPIVSDLPFGHDGENAALPVGVQVELDGDKGTLCLA